MPFKNLKLLSWLEAMKMFMLCYRGLTLLYSNIQLLENLIITPHSALISSCFYCRHAAKLLKCLCGEVTVREDVKVYDGIPLLLRYTIRQQSHNPSVQTASCIAYNYLHWFQFAQWMWLEVITSRYLVYSPAGRRCWHVRWVEETWRYTFTPQSPAVCIDLIITF